MENSVVDENIKFICGNTICPQTVETHCALCRVPPENHQTVKFQYTKIRRSKSRKSCHIQTDKVFIPSPTCSWLNDIEHKDLPQLFDNCWQDFTRRNSELYTTADLSPSYSISPGTLGRGHLVQFRNPWDFHIMLEDILDFSIEKSRFATINSELKLFETSAQLMHGLEIILSKFVKYALSRSKNFHYKTGDLVICCVEHRHKYNAYRAIVLNQKEVITEDCVQSHAFLCYMLDTGETIIISSEFLHPLPYVFIGFPPLAIKCALHGIFPIAPNWSQTACSKMFQALVPSNRMTLTVEFYSKNPVHIPAPGSTLVSVSREDAYFVELFAGKDGKNFLNVSNLLISEDLAIEWCLTPQKPALQTKCEDQPNDKSSNTVTTEEIEYFITRDDVLHFCGTTPHELKLPSPNQIRTKIERLVRQRPSYFQTCYLEGFSNIFATKIEIEIDDEDKDKNISEKLFQPAIPLMFTNNYIDIDDDESIIEEPQKVSLDKNESITEEPEVNLDKHENITEEPEITTLDKADNIELPVENSIGDDCEEEDVEKILERFEALKCRFISGLTNDGSESDSM